jgi:uncharacterized protein (DUF427 family)
MLGGQVVVDSNDVLYVWETPYYPQYYFPLRDVLSGALEPTATVSRSPSRGPGSHYTVRGGNRVAVDGARRHAESPIEELRDRVRFDWGAMDSWFEEDVEVFVHPRSPHTRIDALISSRIVRVEMNGIVLAESHRPTFLFETGLPRRTYFPKVDVHMELFIPTQTSSMCPYKGTARYWSVRPEITDAVDVAWSYPTPLPESAPIAGLVAFYDERVDLFVDGVQQPRPHTPFS